MEAPQSARHPEHPLLASLKIPLTHSGWWGFPGSVLANSPQFPSFLNSIRADSDSPKSKRDVCELGALLGTLYSTKVLWGLYGESGQEASPLYPFPEIVTQCFTC